MTEITCVVTIIASISFVMFIIYPLLKGEKTSISNTDNFSISPLEILKNNLHNDEVTKSQESIETLKESIGFLEDIDKEYEKEIKELIVPDTKRKYIICLKDDCYTPIKNFMKKCPPPLCEIIGKHMHRPCRAKTTTEDAYSKAP